MCDDQGAFNGVISEQFAFDFVHLNADAIDFHLPVQPSDEFHAPVREIPSEIAGFIDNILFLCIQRILNKTFCVEFRSVIISLTPERRLYEDFADLTDPA